jgi:hypothetical protein
MGWRLSCTGVAAGLLAVITLAGCGSGSEGPDPVKPTATPLVFVSHTPAATPARSFTAGSYLVGQDVELGRYSTGAGGGGCRWLQRDSSGAVIDQSGPDRPTQVLTLLTRGSELVVDGAGCTFERMP